VAQTMIWPWALASRQAEAAERDRRKETCVSSALIAALIAGGVSLFAAILSAVNARRIHEAKVRADAESARFAQDASLRAQEARLRTELRTEFMAEEAIRALLTHERWSLRSFDEIKRRVRGFSDDELRRLLVRAGAVAFDRQQTGEELWGLRERNLGRL
jgi:hypothetical protein